MKKLSLIIAILLINLSLFAQEVNFIRSQNSMIIDFNTGDTLSSHTSDAEALQQLLNYKTEGKVVKMIGSIYEVDVKETVPDWNEIIVIDTVQVTGFNYSDIRSPIRAVINYGSNILVASKDTAVNVPNYTFTAKLEQSKHWPTATTSYKVIDFPFYMESKFDYIDNKLIIRGYIPTRQSRISFKIQEEETGEWVSVKEFLPGSSQTHEGGYQFYFTIDETYAGKVGKMTVWDENNNLASKQFIIPE